MSENRRLGRWEIQILECVRAKSRTEKKIAKAIGLDSSIVSPMITDLMMDGHIEMVTKRRLRFFYMKLCTLTPEGLAALENAKRNSWDGMIMEIKNRISEAIADARDQSPAFNATWQVASAGYKITKFILSK